MTPIQKYQLLAFTVSQVSAGRWQSVIREILTKPYSHWHFSEGALELERIYSNAPTAGGRHFHKYVTWKPQSGDGSVFFADSMDGWCMLTKHVSRVITSPFIAVRISNNLNEHPVCSMTWWQNGVTTRHIHVLKENRWQFWQEGNVRPYEDPANYMKKRTVDRFTKEICIQYLQNEGFNVEDPKFWETDSVALYGNQTAWDSPRPAY